MTDTLAQIKLAALPPEHDGAARRPAGRSDSGGARGSAHHHVDHDLGAVGDKPCGSGQMVVRSIPDIARYLSMRRM